MQTSTCARVGRVYKKGILPDDSPIRLQDNRGTLDVMFLRTGVMKVTTANNKRQRRWYELTTLIRR
jgi:hypothetical protein